MLFVIILLSLILATWLILAEVDRARSKAQGVYWHDWNLPFLAPWNYLIDQASPVELRTPIAPLKYFPGHALLEANYEAIAQEALNMSNQAVPIGDIFMVSKIVKGTVWKTAPLFMYGREFPENITQCPITTSLLRSLPGVQGAMFSVIPPRQQILPHRGPGKHYLRYHLGLVIPEDYNSCFISIANVKYPWRAGKSLLFDDTYAHYVRNDTDEPRVILFVDVERPINWSWVRKINQWLVNSEIVRSLIFQNADNEKTKNL